MRNHQYKAVDVQNNKLILAQGTYYECKCFFDSLEQERRFTGYRWEINLDTAILKEIKTGKIIQTIKIAEDGVL